VIIKTNNIFNLDKTTPLWGGFIMLFWEDKIETQYIDFIL